MSTHQHHAQALGQNAAAAVLTVSDTRTPETDQSGRLIRTALESAGHQVVAYEIVPDEPGEIRASIREYLRRGEIHTICITGGTGIAKRDGTIEVVQRLLDKRLPGFGELFRMLSYQEIGPAAMLSRAVAGLTGETFIFSMPGSTNAVKLAMEKLIVPELGHLLWERGR